MTVRVSFDYEPEDPDPEDRAGVSTEEFDRVMDLLMMQLGAENISMEAKEE